MLKILDAVKSLVKKVSVKLDLKNAFKLFSDNKTINIHVDGGIPQTIVVEGATIKINPQKLEEDDAEAFQKLLKNALSEEGMPLLTTDAAKLLEDYRTYSDLGGEVLNALRGFVDPKDLLALRAAFFIRAQHEAKRDITGLKSDIIRVYGERGRKICNLCTSAYFENMIVPTLNEMKKSPEFSSRDFTERYEVIVEEEAFSLFVHGGMNAESLYKDIVTKLGRNKAYGQYYVNVHAINSANIRIVKDALALVRERLPQVEKTKEERSGNSIFVRLESSDTAASK